MYPILLTITFQTYYTSKPCFESLSLKKIKEAN